ncbi:MAG: sigma-54-dependent Fis family transcriptional regulator, partial [Candidatus Latescibacteria bacterium]|nr:sigma-54-dependent Fis family transcriptional regulator [Candidatus Latescibacterota bacterium]
TGTGKGLVARAIHGLSARQNGPFIPINCGAIAEGLVESEIFGHEKGAFTGAVTKRLGRVELAEGGTLFLDEIGDLPLAAQVKLLRVLEERTFERVGGEKTLRADVRMIAATNRDLERMVRERQFREDLYFRLRVYPIEVPPLRERREDIPLLVQYFAKRFAQHLNRSVPGITSATLLRLQGYAWPGNVRELEHVVQRAVLLCRDDIIGVETIARMLVGEKLTAIGEPVGSTVGLEHRLVGEEHPSAGHGPVVSLSEQKRRLAEEERRQLETVLEETGWVIYGPQGAAQRLGMHPERLRSRMRKYGLRRRQ